ncbi:hypothetical protein GOP47_0012882 [Adiantum capillus-veneris]|uniref:Uncharacterized protein n=1 Tax=Adiantum capillus-veneris TaxID=13818 RepID=A0A9D4ZH82_ADICA|nr:hypothetical protein GOP47_0012882 [Adiantum capillus-veneris]
MDEVTGMPLVPTSERSNCKDMVRPLAWLKHKCFWLSSPMNDMEIMYEVSGHKVRGILVQRGQPGDVPPSLEPGDHVIVSSHDCRMKLLLWKLMSIIENPFFLGWITKNLKFFG